MAALRPDPVLSGRLRLRQMRLLEALGETANLRRAAAAIGIAQPAATRLLADLETALGERLFERSARGMQANGYGLAMIRHARRALNELSRATEEVGALASGGSGVLRLGTVTSVAPILLPRAAAKLRADLPGLRLSIVEGGHELLLAALARGEIDALLARAMPPAGRADLRYELLLRERYLLVAAPDHPLARRRRLALADVVDQGWVLPPESFPFRRELDVAMAQATGRRPADVIESVSILNNQTLLQESRLLAVMPASYARRLARGKALAILRLAAELPKAPVALLTANVEPELRTVARFAEVLRRAARELSE